MRGPSQLPSFKRGKAQRQIAQYDLHVEQDPFDAGKWLAWQALRPIEINGQQAIVTADGGGLSMRIDKCDGEVSEVSWHR